MELREFFSEDAIKLERLQLPVEVQQKLRVARLITEIVDQESVIRHLMVQFETA